MTAITMDVDGLDNPDRAQLLSVVDKFRTIGISKEISLPQLVVVGDQSSGKSSLLEGLTGISFPTHSGLCTRFATRIILRRSAERQVKVSIIPGASSANAAPRRKALLAFAPKLNSNELVGPRFTEIMDEAAISMGLPPSTQKNVDHLDRRFSDDVLSITLSGPEHQHLSIVDVPGLFHNPTPTQTQGDLNTIRAMIKSYMEDKRTIMLTVMDALNNFANQEIFNMAKEADETGERIVGVITKCDAVSPGDEAPIIKVAQNESYVFRHGWFAVRNRSTKEKNSGYTIADRHVKEEAFFQQEPWSQLSKDRVGIPALKTYLAQILYDHIRNEFPQLVDDIRTKMLETRKQVDGFGESRNAPSEQRRFLTRIANQFQNGNNEASRGTYGPTLKSKDPRKLRMHIAAENDKLVSKVHAKGHMFKFKRAKDVDQNQVQHQDGHTGEKTDDDEEIQVEGETVKAKMPAGAIAKKNPSTDSESESEEEQDEKTGLTDIYDWIRTQYRTSRGAELPGTVNPAVLEGLFRQQAASWEPIAKDYLTKVNKAVLRHIKRSCEDLITDKTIRKRIGDRNKRAVAKSFQLASAQLDQILQDEMGGVLQTTNNYFAENLAKNRHDRVLIRLKKFLAPMEQTAEGGIPAYVGLNLDDLIKRTHLSNEDSAVYDIHDILKAYYKVAMKRFVDNVTLQVTERHYMGPTGPLKYFSPGYVGGLSDDELKNLAGESKATTMERERLTTLLGQLEKALKLGEAQQ